MELSIVYNNKYSMFPAVYSIKKLQVYNLQVGLLLLEIHTNLNLIKVPVTITPGLVFLLTG